MSFPRPSVHWVRSGFMVKNNSLGQDGGRQWYVLRYGEQRQQQQEEEEEEVEEGRGGAWLNLTINNIDRWRLHRAGHFRCF